jgi:undecaprenyl-diphosphatase
MTFLQATVYGVVQGLTEFLPVSSSAHLALLPRLTGWKDPGLTFDVALHMGTLLAVALYFFKDWLALFTRERKTVGWLALASVPAALSGVLLENAVETTFRSPQRIALTLSIFGVLLALSDLLGKRRRAAGPSDILTVGLAQALALMPGVSRSGVTITTGLALGLKGEEAARLSFLLALPITAGAGIFKLRHLEPSMATPAFFWAIAVSALTGLWAVHVLLRQVRGGALWPYGVYRVILAAGLITLGGG